MLAPCSEPNETFSSKTWTPQSSALTLWSSLVPSVVVPGDLMRYLVPGPSLILSTPGLLTFPCHSRASDVGS